MIKSGRCHSLPLFKMRCGTKQVFVYKRKKADFLAMNCAIMTKIDFSLAFSAVLEHYIA